MDWTLVFGVLCAAGGGAAGYFLGHNKAVQDTLTNVKQGFIKVEGELYEVNKVGSQFAQGVGVNISQAMGTQTSNKQASSPSPTTPPTK